jgi:hypothetical protein
VRGVTLARRTVFTPADLRGIWDLAPLVTTALENHALDAYAQTEQHRHSAIFDDAIGRPASFARFRTTRR